MKSRTTNGRRDDVRAHQQWGQGVLVGLCWSAAIFEINQDLKNRLVDLMRQPVTSCRVLISKLHLIQCEYYHLALRSSYIFNVCYLIFFHRYLIQPPPVHRRPALRRVRHHRQVSLSVLLELWLPSDKLADVSIWTQLSEEAASTLEGWDAS